MSSHIEKNNKALLRLIGELQDYAIILLDTEGIIQNWNLGAQRIKGYAADEIVGKHFRIFYTLEDQQAGTPENLLKKAAETGKAVDEGRRVRKDGSTFWGSITITSIRDEAGELIGFGKVTHDLTDKKKAQRTQALEMRNLELEQFNYIASHDLQEPLRTVLNYIQVIKEDHAHQLDDAMNDYLEKIESSSNRMRTLIRSLLDYSRLGKQSELSKVDTRNLVKEVLEDMSAAIHMTKATILVNNLPTLEGLATELRQLFQNLISNGIKFAKQNVAPVIKIDCHVEDPGWRFTISDNGIGIDAKHASRIFHIFERVETGLKHDGHGIGLANCKKIVELHEGRIWVDSNLGDGSNFHFTISNKLL